MITNTLYRKYQQVLNKKRFDAGGNMNQTGIGSNSNVPYAMLGNAAAGLVDDFNTKNEYGYDTNLASNIGKDALKDAGTGAQIGSMFGPEGTLVGAGVGATVGLVQGVFDEKGNKTKTNNAQHNQIIQQRMQGTAISNAVEGADPSLRLGNQGANYFAKGGTIHIKPSHKGMFTKYKERTGKTTAEALHSSSPHVRQMANFARNASHWHHKAEGGDLGDPTITAANVAASKASGYNDLTTIDRINAVLAGTAKGAPLYGDDRDALVMKARIFRSGNVGKSPEQIINGFYGQPDTGSPIDSMRSKFNKYNPIDQYYHTPDITVRQGDMTLKEKGGVLAGEAFGGEGSFGSYVPVASLKSEDGSNPNLQRNPLSEMMMQNGDAKMLSSDNTLIQGPSHADGGVNIPELGTQVEGGETTKDNFVFSKQLGFAKLHLPIARAIGKIEKKVQTPDRVNALKRLRGREDELANQQETLKSRMGMQ